VRNTTAAAAARCPCLEVGTRRTFSGTSSRAPPRQELAEIDVGLAGELDARDGAASATRDLVDAGAAVPRAEPVIVVAGREPDADPRDRYVLLERRRRRTVPLDGQGRDLAE
jgi:hypothetical protein